MSSKPEVADGASYDVLVLSPHLDDAAFSVGGYLHRLAQREGKRALVANVFTAEAPDELSGSVEKLHGDWVKAGGFEHKIMASRRREEEAACRRLGVDVSYLGFLDAAYRRDDQGKPLYDPVAKVMARRQPQDNQLLVELENAFRQLPEAVEWIVPMGVGHHVDHLLVREAAEGVRGRGGLLYYEDFPYAQNSSLMTKARISRLLSWRKVFQTLSEADVEAKIEAIACHRSQLSEVFRDHDGMAMDVREFSSDGERLWRCR